MAGIGGAGLNVLDRISLDRMMDSSLVSMHTDVRVLSQAMASVKIQLGADIMRGIGSGGDPELGREAASSSREHIKAALQGHDMVFLCVGLGGGTGSGAAPVAAPVELPVANEIVQPEPIVTHPEEVEPVVHAEIAPEPAPIPQPVAPAPVQEVVLPEPQPIEPVVAEVRPQSIFIEEEALEEEAEPEPEPEPVVQRTVQTPAPTSSVFAVIEDDDDLEEEEAEAFIPAPQPVAPAPAPRRSLMSAIIGGSKPEPAAAPAPVHQERRPVREEAQAPEPAAQESHVFDTVKAQIRSKEAQAKIDYQQASFNLTPEEVSRFKGTEKIFHEGDDLDVPTWMRAKHKLKS